MTLNTGHQLVCEAPRCCKRHHQMPPQCLAHSAAGHRGQFGTRYRQTTCSSSPWLTYDMTEDYNKTRKTQSPLSLRPPYPPTYTLPTYFFYKHHTDGRQSQHTKGARCTAVAGKIIQRNNIRRANTCVPALNPLNEEITSDMEITSDIQKHKQTLWKEHLDAQWDHMHNTHILCKTIHTYILHTK